MGSSVSTGRDNDELIDNLLEADYLKSSMVENVFRAVDRANYFLPSARGGAYKDQAWKHGNLHLSAPCIYSEVMEGLKLEPGLSFLNLGSGTGYFSTMAGLILGSYGINHGVELQKDVVDYANKKLEEFKKTSYALDKYDFCEPKFIEGNCLCFTSDVKQYDRVYCGAACPEQHENYMKHLIKVGGILVMPLNDHLLQIERVSQDQWDVKTLLPVSFASLLSPNEEERANHVKMVDTEPLSLQAACRAAIRIILRHNVEEEHPEIVNKNRCQPKRPRKKRAVRRLTIPIFDESGDETSDREYMSRRMHLDSDTDTNPAANTAGVDTIVDLMLCIDYEQRPGQVQNERTADSDRRENGTNAIAIENSTQTVRSDHINQLPKREKFDSGIAVSTPSESDDEIVMDTTSDSDSSNGERMGKRSSQEVCTNGGGRHKKVNVSSRFPDSESDSNHSQDNSSETVFLSPYTEYMRMKIQALPLPPILKSYVNFYKDFE